MPLCCLLSRLHVFLQQERDLGDEYGWKQVHGDVFRSASYPLLFSSLIGSGYQLAVVGFLVIIMSIIGDLYTEYVTISQYLSLTTCSLVRHRTLSFLVCETFMFINCSFLF